MFHHTQTTAQDHVDVNKDTRAKDFLRELNSIPSTGDGDERKKLLELWIKMQVLDLNIRTWNELSKYLKSNKRDNPLYTPKGNRLAREDMHQGLQSVIDKESSRCCVQ